jgi:hypothetical protein
MRPKHGERCTLKFVPLAVPLTAPLAVKFQTQYISFVLHGVCTQCNVPLCFASMLAETNTAVHTRTVVAT